MAESLIAELQRRNVFKVATAYIVLAWVVVQVTDQAVDAFNMPDWVNTVVFFFGIIGFPFVMLFTWAFELTPEGIKREQDVDRTQSITSETGKKINTITIGLLVIALGYFIYESRFQERAPTEIVDAGQTIEQSTAVPQDDSNEVVLDSGLSSLPGSSIAVLPFVNMSSDPEQEFFSDGISEEILNVLAQIPNLHVTSRSSAFSFKGKEIIVSDVARKLGVANVLEGSVRKAGNKVRITAQLIEAGSDKHLWSETYDRELDDVFAVQDEISKAIVEALKDKLNLEQEIELVASTQVKPEAHQAFLKGRSLLERRNQEDLELAMAEFATAIDLEPTYARAWMGKAWATIYLSENNYGDIPMELAHEQARVANEMALKLNPNLAESYALRGSIWGDLSEFVKAAESFEKAIDLNANFVYAYVWYAGALDFAKPESFNKQMELRKKAYQLDPMNILTLVNYSYSLINYSDFDQALAIAERIKVINPKSHFPYQIQLQVYRDTNQLGKSVYAMRKAHELSPNIGILFDYGFGLTDLGLIDEATALVEGTELDIMKYAFQSNIEAMITQTRLTLPRSEDDSFGNFRRAVAETFAGNCPEAIEYFKKTNCTRCNWLLHCYKQVDAQDEFEQAMAIRDNQIDIMKAANYGPHAYEEFEAFQNYLRGDVNAYISLLRQDVQNGRVMFNTDNNPLMTAVAEHEAFPKLMELSEQNRLRQLAIYQDLVASETE